MKRVLSSCSAALAAACLSSCTAVHPLPEDVTDSTIVIVEKIRCEAWQAVRKAIVQRLRKTGDLRDAELADALVKSPTAIDRIIESTAGRDITNIAYANLNRYYRGAIGYEFQLDIEETDNNGFSANLLDAFSTQDRRFGLGAGLKRQRQAQRTFVISDEFSDLADLAKAKTKSGYLCDPPARASAIYPISGKIGLEETVSTFLTLHESVSVDGKDKDAAVTQFTDLLLFTTTVSGNLNPTIVFQPYGIFDFQRNVGLTNSYTRVDKHQVTVSIRIPLSPKGDAERSAGSAASSKIREEKVVSPSVGVINDINERKFNSFLQRIDRGE